MSSSITTQLKAIDQLASEISKAIAAENYKAARRLLRRLDSFDLEFAIQQVRIPAVCRMLIAEHAEDTARSILISQMGYCWGDPESLEILRSLNAVCTNQSSLFIVLAEGSLAPFGIFTKIDRPCRIKMEIIADSSNEAVGYLDEVCGFNEVDSRIITSCNKVESLQTMRGNRGILKAYPIEDA